MSHNKDVPLSNIDQDGLPTDKSYLECGLPVFVQESVNGMKVALDRLARGEKYLHFDCDYCDLQSTINVAEVGGAISSEVAWYLREKYLGLKKEDLRI